MLHDGCTRSPAVGERFCVECMECSAERGSPLEDEVGDDG
jgi:hypothetical protein